MIVEEEARKCGMYYINYRWLGGLLTNFQTVKKSIARLNEIEELSKSDVWGNFTKKEVSSMTKERDKLLHVLGGIREMTELPAVVFIVDPHKETIAVHESTKLGLPIVAIIDTNCDPDAITFPIPGNDDALKSIKLIASLLTENILAGRREYDTNRSIKQKDSSVDAAAAQPSTQPA